jgi:hypothetical protein
LSEVVAEAGVIATAPTAAVARTPVRIIPAVRLYMVSLLDRVLGVTDT